MTRKQSAVTQKIDGVEIDLNKVSRKEALTLMGLIGDEPENMDGLVERVVVAWPFEQPINKDGFLDLGFGDSLLVQNAVLKAADDIIQKK